MFIHLGSGACRLTGCKDFPEIGVDLGSNLDKDACQEKCWSNDDCHVLEHELSGQQRCVGFKGSGDGFQSCLSGAECYLKRSK